MLKVQKCCGMLLLLSVNTESASNCVCVLPLQGLHLVDTQTGAKRDLSVHGLFYGIGHRPNSKLVAGQIELDEAGYVKVGAVLGVCSATLVFGLVRCQQTLPTR